MFKDVEKAKEAASYLKSKGFKVKLRKLYKKEERVAIELNTNAPRPYKGESKPKPPPAPPKPPKPEVIGVAMTKMISDEEFINRMTPCGEKLLTKEQLLAQHRVYGGSLLTWEELVNNFTNYS